MPSFLEIIAEEELSEDEIDGLVLLLGIFAGVCVSLTTAIIVQRLIGKAPAAPPRPPAVEERRLVDEGVDRRRVDDNPPSLSAPSSAPSAPSVPVRDLPSTESAYNAPSPHPPLSSAPLSSSSLAAASASRAPTYDAVSDAPPPADEHPQVVVASPSAPLSKATASIGAASESVQHRGHIDAGGKEEVLGEAESVGTLEWTDGNMAPAHLESLNFAELDAQYYKQYNDHSASLTFPRYAFSSAVPPTSSDLSRGASSSSSSSPSVRGVSSSALDALSSRVTVNGITYPTYLTYLRLRMCRSRSLLSAGQREQYKTEYLQVSGVFGGKRPIVRLNETPANPYHPLSLESSSSSVGATSPSFVVPPFLLMLHLPPITGPSDLSPLDLAAIKVLLMGCYGVAIIVLTTPPPSLSSIGSPSALFSSAVSCLESSSLSSHLPPLSSLTSSPTTGLRVVSVASGGPSLTALVKQCRPSLVLMPAGEATATTRKACGSMTTTFCEYETAGCGGTGGYCGIGNWLRDREEEAKAKA